jgi:hypothetical protein
MSKHETQSAKGGDLRNVVLAQSPPVKRVGNTFDVIGWLTPASTLTAAQTDHSLKSASFPAPSRRPSRRAAAPTGFKLALIAELKAVFPVIVTMAQDRGQCMRYNG